MKQLLVAVALAFGAGVAQAATTTNYYWTGAADNAWTNAANWQVDGASGRVAATLVPGVITNGTGEVVYDNPEGCAVFGPVSDGAQTMIDTAGTKEVKYVRFAGASAPSYQIGLSDAAARFGLAEKAYVTVDEDVVNDQELKAPLILPAVDTRTVNLTNNSPTATLILNSRNDTVKAPELVVSFYGSGTIRYQGVNADAWGGVFNLYQSGLFESTSMTCVRSWRVRTLAGSGTLRHLSCAKAGVKCFSAADGGDWDIYYSIGENTLLDGPGYFQPSKDWASHGYWMGYTLHGSISVAQDKKLEVRAIIKTIRGNQGGSADWGLHLQAIDAATSGGGLVELCTTNMILGALAIDGGVTVRAAKFGPKFSGDEWEKSYLGRHQDILIGLGSGTQQGGNGTLEYSGAGETGFDSTFTLAGAYEGCLRNAGTGSLEFAGVVTSCVAGASFRFEADTAPIDFTGTFGGDIPVGMTVSGASKTIFHETPPASSVTMDSGTLAVAEGVAAFELPTVSVSSGASTIAVPEDSALTIAALDVTAGRLDISAGDGATVTVTDHTGTCPAGVFLNGIVAQWDDNGVLSQNVTAWKTATDGAWSVADNWSAGVPVAGRQALLAAEGGSYTVTASGADVNDRIIITNGTADATTTLVISNGYAKTDAFIELRSGAVLSVTNGLTVTNTAVGTGNFTVGTGARLECIGGTVTLPGADFVTKGEAEVEYSQGAVLQLTPGFTFGSGTTRFTGTSKFQASAESGPVYIAPTGAGETALVDLNPDNTATAATLASQITRLHSDYPNSKAVLTLRGAKGKWNTHGFNSMRVGWQRGFGELNVSNGFYGGLCSIASWDYEQWNTTGYAGPYNVTGVVNVAGGNFQPSSWVGTYSHFVRGCVVGDGGFTTHERSYDGSFYRGTVNLSSGWMNVPAGSFVVGIGAAEGDVVQTGGELISQSVLVGGKYTFSTILGLFGGEGRYVISNGVATVRPPFFIGGAKPADVGCEYLPRTSYYPIDRHDAKGLLSVCGGTLTAAEYDVIVGADGTGVVELGAAWRDANNAVVTGNFLVKNLVLSNQTASTLRFKLGDDGTAFLSVTNKLTVTDGAKLVVDARAVTAPVRKYTKLASVHAFEGSFGADDIEILFPSDGTHLPVEGTEVLFERNGETGIWLKRGSRGLALMLR